MKETTRKAITGVFIACLLAMLWSYQAGYGNSIDWEVTTTGEIIEFPAWTLETDLMIHEITGEKYLLSENYAGSEIKRNLTTDQVMLSIMWLGLLLFMVTSTYLNRYLFFAAAALLALFLNRLNLFEIGLFGVHSRMVILIPFLGLFTPLIIFHEYKKNTPFLVRFLTLTVLSIAILFGVEETRLFTDHLIANSLFGFTICGLLFLFFISEEIVFGILYVSSSGKGKNSNHLHFIILSLFYLGNLTLYYLDRYAIFDNNLYFFDPFILLSISGMVALWSVKYKASFLLNYMKSQHLFVLTFSLGIISMVFLSHQMIRGNDAIYQAFHYFILYFHLGFGALFFFYIIGNFIDPLIKGFPIFKIAYKERNFPYASARLGGFFVVLGFYFLANQEPYNLLKSGYYNYLSEVSISEGNPLLAKEYALQASFLGYNTHMANYNLGWNSMNNGSEYLAKSYFQSATKRFPSPYAWVNYGNLDIDINANKVQAMYEEALRDYNSGEIENNLGVLHLQKANYDQALAYFEKASPSQSWNQAPLINKWNVLKRINAVDTLSIRADYLRGNFGVRSNILSSEPEDTALEFEFENIEKARSLHKQAYLLNSSYVFQHDSLEKFARVELENSTDESFNSRLRKALVIHLYNKGEVNEAFMMLDYLQANGHQLKKGEYLDAMGKLALDQQAYTLSMEFFNEALKAKYPQALFGKMEVLAQTNQKEKIPDLLLSRLKQYPELTDQANRILEKLDNYHVPEKIARPVQKLDSLSNADLITLGRLNAFHEKQVVAVVDELEKREASGGYELLVDATEINPYSEVLLKKYALFALDWNLIEYADHTLQRLRQLLSASDFEEFELIYNTKKEEVEAETW